MTLIVPLLFGLVVLGSRQCGASFSILSEPRESCAGYHGIADAIAEITDTVEAATSTFDPLIGLQTSLEGLLSSLTVHASCDAVTGSSGLYRIQEGNTVPVQYFCQMDYLGGGWTVIQRRTSGRTNFTRSMAEYRDGFGHPDKEFFLGLTRINLITSQAQHELAILLEAFDGTTASLQYTNFKIADQTNSFRLTTLSGYTGTVGNSLSTSVGLAFSTFDVDSDTSVTTNCANVWGGGWWLGGCGDSNLNGFYRGATPTSVPKTSMVWTAFKGVSQSLKSSTMLIRKFTP